MVNLLVSPSPPSVAANLYVTLALAPMSLSIVLTVASTLFFGVSSVMLMDRMRVNLGGLSLISSTWNNIYVVRDWMDESMDGWTDIEIDRHMDRQIDRHTDRHEDI